MKSLIKILSELIIKNNRRKTLDELVSHGTSFETSKGKTIITSSETVSFSTNSDLQQKVEEIRQAVLDIHKTANQDSEKLLSYVKANGTEVYRINNANDVLNKVLEHSGFITEAYGRKAFYLNRTVRHALSLTFAPAFVISKNKEIDYFALLREFYLWYSMKKGLAGFEFEVQENFKLYMANPDSQKIKKLKYGEMLKLQEAISRDKEATDFVVELISQSNNIA